ncbi:hypothetical protein SNE40_002854 [Patella caerulea]|uniref:Uncharacterized protein n=1 Tax=Patella caerulea TaxID=87958 RepID=A0AAN8KGS9_PATCE
METSSYAECLLNTQQPSSFRAINRGSSDNKIENSEMAIVKFKDHKKPIAIKTKTIGDEIKTKWEIKDTPEIKILKNGNVRLAFENASDEEIACKIKMLNGVEMVIAPPLPLTQEHGIIHAVPREYSNEELLDDLQSNGYHVIVSHPAP